MNVPQKLNIAKSSIWQHWTWQDNSPASEANYIFRELPMPELKH